LSFAILGAQRSALSVSALGVTAATLGPTVPPSLLARGDEEVE
jgi:hypothetical protein